jgi:AcrB/AcrD/AcrF family
MLREAVIAACLTALMILVFLGSWRSTVIIAVSIPLSILTSIIALSALGETINIMTLGGLALAVGILVDDATVAIENINSHLEHGKDLEPAILDGAQQYSGRGAGGQIRVRSGSDPGPIGVRSGSDRGRIRVRSGSDQDPIGVRSESDRSQISVRCGPDRNRIPVR